MFFKINNSILIDGVEALKLVSQIDFGYSPKCALIVSVLNIFFDLAALFINKQSQKWRRLELECAKLPVANQSHNCNVLRV